MYACGVSKALPAGDAKWCEVKARIELSRGIIAENLAALENDLIAYLNAGDMPDIPIWTPRPELSDASIDTAATTLIGVNAKEQCKHMSPAEPPSTPRHGDVAPTTPRYGVTCPRYPSNFQENGHVLCHNDTDICITADKWSSLASKLILLESQRLSRGNSVSSSALRLRNCWTMQHVQPNKAAGGDTSVSEKDASLEDTPYSGGKPHGRSSLLHSFRPRAGDDGGMFFIRHPSRSCNLIYMALSALLILYDIITLPMVAFLFPETSMFLDVMQWCTAVFFTFDIFMSCTVGFFSRTRLEMRLSKIIVNYLKTWCLFDLVVVLIDWILIWAENAGSDTGSTGIIRLARSLRALRCLRILRFARVSFQVLHKFQELAGEFLVVVGRLGMLLSAMLLINHYIACGWYAFGGLADENELSWLDACNVRDSGSGVHYIMALHWSLTQFTPATNNIAPQNPKERIFAICLVLFALVVFTNFISSLTNALGQLKKMNAERLDEETAIRNFLKSQKVNHELGSKIWNFYRNHYKVKTHHGLESDVKFFEHIPRTIRNSLYKEIYAPAMQSYSVFYQIGLKEWHFLFEICIHAMKDRRFIAGNELFGRGEVATQMYVIKSGAVFYSTAGNNLSSIDVSTPSNGGLAQLDSDGKCVVSAPCIISETTLWCHWRHCGLAQAASNCEALVFDAQACETIFSREVVGYSTILSKLQVYAALYANYVLENLEAEFPVTDVANGHELEFERLAARCFQDGWTVAREQATRKSAHGLLDALAANFSELLSRQKSPESSLGNSNLYALDSQSRQVL